VLANFGIGALGQRCGPFLAGRAGLSLHFPKVSPLLYNAAIWKPADAVVAVRRVSLLPPLFAQNTDAGFASAQAPSGANGEGRKNDDRCKWSCSVLGSPGNPDCPFFLAPEQGTLAIADQVVE
jgi:hypothetical protein